MKDVNSMEERPQGIREPDQVLADVAGYVKDYVIDRAAPFIMARLCLADSLGCALKALAFKECRKLLGPVAPGTVVPNGCRVPGTEYVLDPVNGSFNIGTMIRWLDYNDTWLAAEWGHPSDNLGGILAVADYESRCRISRGETPLTVGDVLTAMIKAYEIQGVLALKNHFNEKGLDHVILVKVATAAVTAAMMGADKMQIINALSHAWIDTGPLRTYRHAPNTGSRKSWAAGDATARGTQLAMLVMRGEMGYPTALSAPDWGFYDVIFEGHPLQIPQPLGTYVIENILFKIAFPAEFHAQTAVECSFRLHDQVQDRLEDIKEIRIDTQAPAIRIIDKQGPLTNPADRDHCLQYMVACGLLFGALESEYYEDDFAGDQRIDALREKMIVRENPQYSKDYLDHRKRSIANALKIIFNDGTETERVACEYPLGHPRRRDESLPSLFKKFEENIATRFDKTRVGEIMSLFQNQKELQTLSVPDLMDLFRP